MSLKQVFSTSSDCLPLWHISNHTIKNPKDQTRHYPFQLAYVCYPQHNIHCTICQQFILMPKQQFNGPSMENTKKVLNNGATWITALIILYSDSQGMKYMDLGDLLYSCNKLPYQKRKKEIMVICMNNYKLWYRNRSKTTRNIKTEAFERSNNENLKYLIKPFSFFLSFVTLTIFIDYASSINTPNCYEFSFRAKRKIGEKPLSIALQGRRGVL